MAYLPDDEVESIWEEIEAVHPPKDYDVFRLDRALDSPDMVFGISQWPAPTTVYGAIVPKSARGEVPMFAEPQGGETARLKARFSQRGIVKAGDVLRDRDTGSVWLVRDALAWASPLPKLVATVTNVPDNFVPKALRI